jgi:hypothetical protein
MKMHRVLQELGVNDFFYIAGSLSILRKPRPCHDPRRCQSRHLSKCSTQSIARIARPAPTAAMGNAVAAAAILSDVEAAAAVSEDDDAACVDDLAEEEPDAEVLSACELTEPDEDEDEESAASSDVEVAEEVAAEMTTRLEVSPDSSFVADVAAEITTRLEVSSGSTSVVETSPAPPVSSGPSAAAAAVSCPMSLSKSKSKPTAEA